MISLQSSILRSYNSTVSCEHQTIFNKVTPLNRPKDSFFSLGNTYILETPKQHNQNVANIMKEFEKCESGHSFIANTYHFLEELRDDYEKGNITYQTLEAVRENIKEIYSKNCFYPSLVDTMPIRQCEVSKDKSGSFDIECQIPNRQFFQQQYFLENGKSIAPKLTKPELNNLLDSLIDVKSFPLNISIKAKKEIKTAFYNILQKNPQLESLIGFMVRNANINIQVMPTNQFITKISGKAISGLSSSAASAPETLIISEDAIENPELLSSTIKQQYLGLGAWSLARRHIDNDNRLLPYLNSQESGFKAAIKLFETDFNGIIAKNKQLHTAILEIPKDYTYAIEAPNEVANNPIGSQLSIRLGHGSKQECKIKLISLSKRPERVGGGYMAVVQPLEQYSFIQRYTQLHIAILTSRLLNNDDFNKLLEAFVFNDLPPQIYQLYFGTYRHEALMKTEEAVYISERVRSDTPPQVKSRSSVTIGSKIFISEKKQISIKSENGKQIITFE